MVTVILEVRQCDTCSARAVPLDGIGANCHNCDTGVFAARAGFKDVQVDENEARELEERYDDVIIEIIQ